MLSRMKFEIEPLVAEMLDHLPHSVWISDSTTFFDPAIGGGQFVRAINNDCVARVTVIKIFVRECLVLKPVTSIFVMQ